MSDQKDYKKYPDAGAIHSTSSKKSPKSPDYFGEIAINMKDMTNIHIEDGLHIVKLSGWKKIGPSGKTYLSINVNRFVPENAGNPAPSKSKPADDDDIPF